MKKKWPLISVMPLLLAFCMSLALAKTCTLQQETCTQTSPEGCQQANLTYSCTSTTPTCAAYSTVSAGTCSAANTAGTQNQTAATPNPQNFNNAMKDLALLNAIKHDLSGINPIKIFGGKYMYCDNPMLSGASLTANCCNTNLKPGAHGIFLGCSNEAVKLAGYNRAGTTYEIQAGCNQGVALFGACLFCTEQQENFCVFANELSKIIQIDGREQLAALAAAGYAGATSSAPATFSYFNGNAAQTAGNWAALPATNGNQLWAWQWPGECQSNTAPETVQCPSSPQVYFAYCAQPGCATPTSSEGPFASTSASGTNMVQVNAGKQQSTAVSKYAVVTGSCDSGNSCTYTESAYPGIASGGTGDAVLRATLTWPLYVYSQGTVNGYLTSAGTANAIFWGQSGPMSQQSGTLPTTVNVKYTLGNVEQANITYANAQYTVALPTVLPMTDNYQITGNAEGKITVFGGCHTSTNLCTYTFEVPASVVPKPWYASIQNNVCSHQPVGVDCSGFTLQQFEELNLSKMHLGQVLLAMAPTAPNISQEQTSASNSASTQAANPNAP